MTALSAITLSMCSITTGAFLSFVPNQHQLTSVPTSRRTLHQSRLFQWGDRYNDGTPGNDDDDVDAFAEFRLEDVDWRSFRARLVMTYDSSVSTAEDPMTGNHGPPFSNYQMPGPIMLPTGHLNSQNSPFFGNTNDPEYEHEVQEEKIHPAEIVMDGGDDDVDGIGSLFVFDEEAAQEHFNLLQEGWAYESGNVIETGAVILGGVEQDFGFGLRQQYFHKAAILVLDHDEGKFTKGIILNRPSDRLLRDPDNPNIKWRVWFGGDVQGLESLMPDIVCLHSLPGDRAAEVSTNVMKDIKYCSFDDAKALVKEGVARPQDFWVFCGYAGWAPGQLANEVERNSWYMVSTDSQTLLEEMARQAANADPRDAGLDTWELLMQMIGREETAKDTIGEFDDLMLKEWARHNLLREHVMAAKLRGCGDSTKKLMGLSAVNKLISKAAGFSREEVRVGSLVRASSAERSPFLLDKQEFHKSLVLMISEDENISVGVILNRPSSKGLDVQIVDKETGRKKTVSVPLRYGGEYAVKGQAPLLWLHCSDQMREANIGSPLGSDHGIWSCSPEQATNAMSHGLATPNDFMVISGVSVWTKGEPGRGNKGIQGEILSGNFEPVPSKVVPQVFDKLLTQDLLTGVNLFRLMSLGNAAWSLAGGRNVESDNEQQECNQENDDSLVFRSRVKVDQLADDALKHWISTFLLGAPTSRP